MPRHLLALAALLLSAPGLRPAPAEPPVDLPAPPASEVEELARLRALPPSRIPLRGASLASAIRLLAQASRMSYIAPPDTEFPERITSDVTMSPYELLRAFADNYGVGMEYRRGVWWFSRVDLNELVTKAYTLRFNNLERVTIHSSSINGQLASAGGGLSGASGALGSSAGGGGGNASSAQSGTFSGRTDKIIEDIKRIIGLPTVGLSTPSLDDASAPPAMESGRKPLEAPKVEPIWNPETSELFVVATRQQHSLIAAYLRTVDQPQRLVRIAVKFVETSRNPQQALGADWSQTFLGSGGPISLSGASINTTATSISNAGTATITTGNSSSSGGAGSPGSGAGTPGSAAGSLTPLSVAINLNHPGNLPLPTSLLSAPAFQWTVQAIASDRYSSIVQDPVIYTSNNREVSFKSTTQQPVQQGTTTIGSATAATTTSIAYIDVGTEVTVLPCILPGRGPHRELIQLNLSVDVSSIIGSQLINGNPYPVTSSRKYAYSVTVPVGETLAIAGLEERSRQTTDSKVPIFGDLPVVGYAFKNKTDAVVRTTLLAFITPELVDTDTGGAEASAADPARPAALPVFLHRAFQGTPTETMQDIDRSLDGLPADIASLRQAAGRLNKSAVMNRLDLIGVELALIDVRLGELRLDNRTTGREAALVARDREQLAAVRDEVVRIRTD